MCGSQAQAPPPVGPRPSAEHRLSSEDPPGVRPPWALTPPRASFLGIALPPHRLPPPPAQARLRPVPTSLALAVPSIRFLASGFRHFSASSSGAPRSRGSSSSSARPDSALAPPPGPIGPAPFGPDFPLAPPLGPRPRPSNQVVAPPPLVSAPCSRLLRRLETCALSRARLGGGRATAAHHAVPAGPEPLQRALPAGAEPQGGGAQWAEAG